MRKKIICYLTFGESISSALLRNQSYNLIKKISQKRDDQFRWIAFVSPTDLLSYKGSRVDLYEEAQRAGIELFLYPLPILYSRWFLPRLWLLPVLMLVGALCLTWNFLRYGRPVIIHNRGYSSALLAVLTKGVIHQAGILFDPRSLFPEENVTAGNWNQRSINYKMWKRLETYILSQSSVVVTVSAGFSNFYQKPSQATSTQLVVIPCAVSVSSIHNRSSIKNEQLLDNLGFPKDAFVLVYSGSIGRWNSPEEIAKYFYHALRCDPKVCLLVITNGRVDHLISEIGLYGIPKNTYKIISLRSHEVLDYLNIAHAGLQVMEPALDSVTRLGVKFVEYMAAGLPVIVNTHAGAAKDFVLSNNVGVLINDPQSEMEPALTFLRHNYDQMARNAYNLAKTHFDIPVVCEQYHNIYSEMINSE